MTLIIQKPTGAKLNLAKNYVEGDRYFSNVSLLLHGEGANNGTIFTDSSPTPLVVSGSGANPPVTKTDQFKFGSSSIYFSGNTLFDNGGLVIPATTALSFPGDFTFETWIYWSSIPSLKQVVEIGLHNTTGLMIRANSDGTAYQVYSSSSLFTGTPSIVTGSWVHLALTRSGSSCRFFVDGVQGATRTDSAVLNPAGAASKIGDATHTTGRAMTGYLDEVRITKGVARYTANFTPPTAPFADAQY